VPLKLDRFRTRFGGTYEIEPIQLGAPVENEFVGNPIFELCEHVVHEAHPGAKTVPWVIQGQACSFSSLTLSRATQTVPPAMCVCTSL
jgi:hypothetical protein